VKSRPGKKQCPPWIKSLVFEKNEEGLRVWNQKDSCSKTRGLGGVVWFGKRIARVLRSSLKIFFHLAKHELSKWVR
jgi:hypothetical protein